MLKNRYHYIRNRLVDLWGGSSLWTTGFYMYDYVLLRCLVADTGPVELVDAAAFLARSAVGIVRG